MEFIVGKDWLLIFSPDNMHFICQHYESYPVWMKLPVSDNLIAPYSRTQYAMFSAMGPYHQVSIFSPLPCLEFYMAIEDPNGGLHACTANAFTHWTIFPAHMHYIFANSLVLFWHQRMKDKDDFAFYFETGTLVRCPRLAWNSRVKAILLLHPSQITDEHHSIWLRWCLLEREWNLTF